MQQRRLLVVFCFFPPRELSAAVCVFVCDVLLLPENS